MDITPMLIQGGAVGIALYAIYSLHKVVSNHIEHSNDAMNGLTGAINKLIGFLEGKEK